MPLVAVGTLWLRTPLEKYEPGAILECLYSREQRQWYCVKPRPDRSEPNADWVFRRVIDSLQEDITVKELCDLHGVR
jgi:hypothetical protein